MLGRASATMTLDVYTGLLADDLDQVADLLDEAVRRVLRTQFGPESRWTGAPVRLG